MPSHWRHTSGWTPARAPPSAPHPRSCAVKVSPDLWQVSIRIPHHPPCYVVLITGVPCGICIRVQDSVRCILSRHCRHGPCKDRGDSSSGGESKESKHSEFSKCSICSLRLTGMSYMSSNSSSGISAQPLFVLWIFVFSLEFRVAIEVPRA